MKTVERHNNGDVAPVPKVLRVAIVASAGDVLFAAAASSERGLAQQVAGYVCDRAPITLWPADAQRVDRLLSDGRTEEAIATYFGTVGSRWDREQLCTISIGPVVWEA